MQKTVKWIVWIGIALLLIFYPQLFGIYYTNMFVTFAIAAVFAVSLNMLLGFTGLLSFGHAIFFGVGGYATALALTHIEGMGLLTSVLIGFLAAGLLAFILTPLVVRVSGTAFAMLHLAFGQLAYVLALKMRAVTGGEDGLSGFPIPDLVIPGVISIPMEMDPVNFYYFAMVILCLSLWLMWFFTTTPFGQVQRGMRDNVKRIDYLGYKVPQSKAVVYTISGAFAGVTGSVCVLFHHLIAPDGSLSVIASFAPIVAAMIGGVGSFFGPILGAGIYQVLEEVVTTYTDRVELVMGALLILVIIYAPMGFVGLIGTVRQRWFAKSAAGAQMEKTT